MTDQAEDVSVNDCARSSERARIETQQSRSASESRTIAPAHQSGRGLKQADRSGRPYRLRIAPAHQSGRGMKQCTIGLCNRVTSIRPHITEREDGNNARLVYPFANALCARSSVRAWIETLSGWKSASRVPDCARSSERACFDTCEAGARGGAPILRPLIRAGED